jgi:hypothetical protein
MVKVPLAESTVANLAAIMPGAYLNVAADRVDVIPGAGIDLITTAKTLILRPLGATGTEEDFVVWKASTGGGLEFNYDNQAERVFNIEFMGYPDNTKKDTLFTYGDSTAAPAAAVTP